MNFFSDYESLINIIILSLRVSIIATILGGLLAILIGVPLITHNFKFKSFIYRIIYVLMGLPPVLAGLVIYILISRSGVLGRFSLLFTPTAMIIAQTILVFPIVLGSFINIFEKSAINIKKTCISLGATSFQTYIYIIKESKIAILSSLTSGFARAISEVGAVTIVGGNIANHTRVMTTYIALETGKGKFENALILGAILLIISFIINSLLFSLRKGDNFGYKDK